MLTIGYLTAREDPKFEWFANGLVREMQTIQNHPDCPEFQVVVVDAKLWYEDQERRREKFKSIVRGRFDFQHVPPKPTVWQGPTRLTQFDFFAASNARNTVLGLARGKHVAFVDDLSVIMPGWLSGHVHALIHGYVMCGTTSKHKNLVVDEEGRLTSYETFLPGTDSRLKINRDGNIPTGGQWLYGGTFSVPLELALRVNGQDEIYDSIGGEDYDFGIRLGRLECRFNFNQTCGTIESEELHHGYTPMIRLDKPAPIQDGPYGSNVLYNRLMRSTGTWTLGNPFVLREVRDRVLRGEPFPVPTEPKTYWLDGQPLSEIKNTRTGY